MPIIHHASDSSSKLKSLTEQVLLELDNAKAINVQTIEVADITDIADTIIISSGNSKTHVQSIAENLVKKLKALNIPCRIEKDFESEWVLVDMYYIVLHVMQQNIRDFYNLEKMWRVQA